ncbi:hypothetical protein scyTo_0018570, partial [Scyliorhinus torazame]|nr:hypothetical protein [Scyliorhinus torazame]
CLHGDLVVVQEPSFVSGLKGQSVTLYCSYTSDGEDIFRSVVYWFIKEGEDPTVIHPAPPPRYQNRVKFSKYSGSVNTTFQIHPLQLKDTETYYCYISFLVGEQTFTKEGVGTRLFVHEPLVLTPPPNCSCDAPRQRYISCGTQVLDGNLVWIDWLRNGEVVRQENETRLVEPAGNGSERLESQLPLPVCCLGKNLNYTCMLNHISGGIIDKSKHTVVRDMWVLVATIVLTQQLKIACEYPPDVQSGCVGEPLTITFRECVNKSGNPVLKRGFYKQVCNATVCFNESYVVDYNQSNCYIVVIAKLLDKHNATYFLEYGSNGTSIKKEILVTNCATPKGKTGGKEGVKTESSSTASGKQHLQISGQGVWDIVLGQPGHTEVK